MVKIWIDGLVLAFQLLTTVPIRKEVGWDDKRAQASVAFYPLIGLVLGLLLATQAYMLIMWTSFSVLVITAWLLTFSLLYSGGLHLDGWADFHDAVFSRRSQEQKLEIMKDPRVGTFAVLAVLVLLVWRFIFVFETLKLEQISNEFFLALILIPFLTRLLMGWQLLLGSFAKKEGMAAALEPAKGKRITQIYLLWTLLGLLFTLSLYPSFLLLFVGGAFFLFCWLKWVTFQLGGMTGDTLGAGAEGGETLLWAITWLLLSFVMA